MVAEMEKRSIKDGILFGNFPVDLSFDAAVEKQMWRSG